ncbi:MAG: RES domain-containing protein, partial [Phycisphaerales bacterium]|nr:RES domain-containing protein [Phycisphaerales bacterium]
MTARAFRIVQSRFKQDAFSGEGARIHGGRWNSPGIPAVYLS